MRHHISFVLALALALGGLLGVGAAAAGSPALTLAEGVEAHAGIDAIYARFSEGYRTLDAAKVAELYTDDASYLAPGRDLLRGRAAIEKSFEEFFADVKERRQRAEISFEVLERETAGSLGYEVGIYTLRFHGADRQAVNRGKFVVVTRCEEKTCRFQVDGFSSLPPIPDAVKLPES